MSRQRPKKENKVKTQEREIVESELALLARKMGKFIRVTKDSLFQNKVC